MRTVVREHRSGQFTWLLVFLFSSVPLVILPGRPHAEAISGCVSGLLIGAIWQIRSRRDLSDRITAMAKVFGVLLVMGLVLVPLGGEVQLTPDSPGSIYWAAIVLALALTEQVLRRIERHTAVTTKSEDAALAPHG